MEKKNNKKNGKKNRQNAFTLIEILAVVIILGILMIIAIPTIVEYISSSRKKAYIMSANNYVSGVRNKVNSLAYKFTDPAVIYYVPINCVTLEKDGKSPFGEWREAYVVVTFHDNSYNYYWTSLDSAGYGIELTKEEELDADKVKTGMIKIDKTISVEEKFMLGMIEEKSGECTNTPVIAEMELEAGKIGIYNENDLNDIKNNLSGDYVLMNDITLTAPFEPVGNSSMPFNGTFEGRNRTISNLVINKGNTSNVGLFGNISSATIKNLTLKNVEIKGKNNVGGLIGLAYNTNVTNVSINGNIEGTESNVGGIIGQFIPKDKKNIISNNNIDVVIKSMLSTSGGLIGWINLNAILQNAEVTITNNTIHGTINTGGGQVGGLIAAITGGASDKIYIENNKSNANVTSNTNVAGGLIGIAIAGAIRNNVATGNTNVTAGGNVGGLVGTIQINNENQAILIEKNKAMGNVTGGSNSGGLIGSIENETTLNPRNSNVIVQNNTAAGNTSSNTGSSIGGLIGLLRMGTIKKNYAVGNVTSIKNGYVGGLIGQVVPRNASQVIVIEENYSLGNSYGNLNGIGGLISAIYTLVDNSNTIQIRNNYTKGNIKTDSATTFQVGGLVALIGHSSYVCTLKVNFENNYAVSSFLESAGNPSGFVGSISNRGTGSGKTETTYSGNYFNVETSGRTNAQAVQGAAQIGVTGTTTLNLKAVTTFSDWSTSIWQLNDGSYPKLKNVGGNQ